MLDNSSLLDIYARRRQGLKAKLDKSGIKAMLVSGASNRYYLSGFELFDGQCNESSGMLLITAQGKDWLLTDSRFLDEAKRLWPEAEIFIYTGKKFKEIAELAKSIGLKSLAFEPEALCVRAYERLSAHVELSPAPELVEELRIIKDEHEIELVSASMALNHKIFDCLPEMLKPGRSEAEIAWEIEKLARESGAEGMAFPTIVGVGPNAALPHAHPGNAKITEECPVLVDMGVRLGGYCSDQTRTFWVGRKPSDEFRRTLDLVQTAQRKALDILAPGLSFKEAYSAARAHFMAHGVERHFTHSLGHGIGLDTHEAPRLSPLADGTLKPGMLVTVEPGLYYPEWGGVRWEHVALITEQGSRIL